MGLGWVTETGLEMAEGSAKDWGMATDLAAETATVSGTARGMASDSGKGSEKVKPWHLVKA
jgi:hypothetical protein